MLREYTVAVGLKPENFVGINPKIANSNAMVKTASTQETKETKETKKTKETIADKLQNMWKDPFNIEEKSNTDHMKKADWEGIKQQNALSDAPSMNSNFVKALRGGEDYNKNSNTKLPSNMNSISDPKAIEKLANDTTEGSRERIRKEKEDRQTNRIKENKEWQTEMAKKADQEIRGK